MDLEFWNISKHDKNIEESLFFINKVRNSYANQFLHDSRTFTLEDTRKWFFETNPDWWLIFKDNKPVGYFRLSNYDEVNRNIMIGADIAPEFTNQGIGYEAYTKFMRTVFDEYYVHKIYLEVLVTNTRAIALYNKLGFTVEGIRKQHVWKNDTMDWVDSMIMSIFNEES